MTRARCSLRPSLEILEARDTPAGTVTATFVGGRLTLTGDAAANTLLVTQEDDGRLTISDDESGTQFQLNGGPVQDAVTLPARVTGPVTINLGAGADDVTIDGVDLPGSLTINGGNGEGDGPTGNTVRLLDIALGGGLTITNLAGKDSTYLGGSVVVHGGLTIRNGSGGADVWGDQTTYLSVDGLFSVAGGAGHDLVSLWGGPALAVGGLAFNSGTDADGSQYTVHADGEVTIAGGVSIINGPGSDANDVGGENVTIGRGFVVQNGAGGSSTVLRATAGLSVGQVSVTSGAGYDDNTVEGQDTALIRGNVRFANGPGIGANSVFGGRLLSVGGNVTFVNGSGQGLHLHTVYASDVRVAGAVTVRSGDGNTDTSISATARIYVGGPTRVISAAGTDQVLVGVSRVEGATVPTVDVGPVWVNNGDGGSQTAIIGSRLAVRGSVDVMAWDGTDQVAVASVGDSASVTGHVFIDIGPGDLQQVGVGASDGDVFTITGGLGVWTDDTAGPTLVSLAGVDARAWTEVWTGGGSDTVRVSNSTFAGAFDLDTGDGDDSVYLEWKEAATTFRGPVWVYTGDGDDQVWVAGDFETVGQVTFGGATHWDGGTGADLLELRYNGSVFLGPDPAVAAFETAF